MLYTTLNDIKKHSPCGNGWEKLLKSLGKTKSDDEQLSFKTILNSNGFDDAIWCLRVLKDNDKEIRLYAVWCARQVEYLDKSGTAKEINDVTEKFAHGEATHEQLAAARDAARDAAWDAASDAAWAAAWAAARDAASDTARDAASDAAWAAAWDAARDAARDAAWDAARDAASDAAWAAAWDAQKEEFIKRFCTEE